MRNYNITLRNLSTPDNIMDEIEKLDIFNHPSQFDEMNDQLYDQYGLMIKLKDDPRVEGTKTFDIIDDYGRQLYSHGFSYIFPTEAKIEGFIKIAKLIKELMFKCQLIDKDKINEHIRHHEVNGWRLPAYIKIIK